MPTDQENDLVIFGHRVNADGSGSVPSSYYFTPADGHDRIIHRLSHETDVEFKERAATMARRYAGPGVIVLRSGDA